MIIDKHFKDAYVYDYFKIPKIGKVTLVYCTNNNYFVKNLMTVRGERPLLEELKKEGVYLC